MKYKVDEIVKLKHVTEEDKQKSQLTYYDGFKKYEGLTGTILAITKSNKYEVLIHTSKPNTKFFYEELWLEKLTEFEAF